jgi:PAS domain S-box-containing protein
MSKDHISLRLGIAFSLLIALLVAVGWLGLRQMAHINRDLEEIANERWAKVQLAREALSYSNLNNRITMEIFFLKDKTQIDPLLARRAENTGRISALVQKIEEHVESGKEKDLLDAIKAARTPYIDSYLRGVALLVNKHNYEEAQRNMAQDTLPLLITYHNAWNAFVEFQGDQMDEAARASRASYAATRKLTLGLIILSFLVATLIAVFVTRSLTAEIAQRKRAEQELARNAEELARSNEEKDALLENAARFRIVAEAATDAIVTIDQQSRILFVNPAAGRIFGYEQAEMLGQSLTMLIPPHLREHHRAGLKRYIATGQKHLNWARVEITGLHKSGAEIPVEISFGEFTAEGRHMFAAILRDVTERKRAEQELAQRAEELARSNAELEMFAYVASHDLQEPLRMVASYTQLLARRYKEKLDAEAHEFIGFAVDGASRMQQLIQDLLSYSRLTTKGKPRNLTQSEAVCNVALENLQKSIEDSRAVVCVGPLPAVLADATQLTQLFQNLIGNAIKYRNERKPEIRVAAKPDGDEWLFSIQDNGIGIDPQYFERIFQMFQRLHTRAEYSGTGIGLALCRKIVERHGGRIWVESQPGKGSTFLFTIPQAKRMEK